MNGDHPSTQSSDIQTGEARCFRPVREPLVVGHGSKAAAEPPHSKASWRIRWSSSYQTSHSAEEREMGHPSRRFIFAILLPHGNPSLWAAGRRRRQSLRTPKVLGGFVGRAATKPPTPLRSAEWGTLRGDLLSRFCCRTGMLGVGHGSKAAAEPPHSKVLGGFVGRAATKPRTPLRNAEWGRFAAI